MLLSHKHLALFRPTALTQMGLAPADAIKRSRIESFKPKPVSSPWGAYQFHCIFSYNPWIILLCFLAPVFFQLNQRNMTAGYTYLKEQWYLLQNYLSITTSPPIAFPSIVIEGGSSVSTELFAVWVDGLTIRKDILLARAPRTTLALVAFWQIVFKRKVTTKGSSIKIKASR